MVVVLDENTVCHVKKCNWWEGLQKMRCPVSGMITIERTENVISEDDETFLGHEIPVFRQAINTRQMIKKVNNNYFFLALIVFFKRAEACSNPPLVFSYDIMNNCEGMANSLIGFKQIFTVQGEEAPRWCDSLFCCFRCLCPFRRRSLAEAMKNRLKERDLWDDNEQGDSDKV